MYKYIKNIKSVKIVKKYYLSIFILFILFLLFIYKLRIHNYKKENFKNNKNKIPKKIFTYWNEVEITNPFVKKNIEFLKNKIPSDFEFIVYNENNIKDELGEYMKYSNHSKNTPTNFSDFIRYYLIHKYGGVWIDSTYFILDFEKAILNKYKAYEEEPYNTGYYEFKRHSVGNEISEKHYESWFMIAPPNDPYIEKVLNQFKEAATIGFPNYKKKLREEQIDLRENIQSEDDYYLMIYAIVRKVLKENPNYKIKTFDLNNVLFDTWDNNFLNEAFVLENLKKYEGIKLTRFHRSVIEDNHKIDNFFNILNNFYK